MLKDKRAIGKKSLELILESEKLKRKVNSMMLKQEAGADTKQLSAEVQKVVELHKEVEKQENINFIAPYTKWQGKNYSFFESMRFRF